MQPTDYRDLTFADLRARLRGQRQDVLNAWFDHGPGTTREVAEKSGLSLLTLRPRTTELYQMGALKLIEKGGNENDGHEGTYLALAPIEWEQNHARARAENAVSMQAQLI